MELGINYLMNMSKKFKNKHYKQPVLDVYRPEDIMEMKTITDGYLVAPGRSPIEFTCFSMREMESDRLIFEIRKSQDEGDVCTTQSLTRYDLTPEFLNIPTLGATVEFKVGPEPIQELRMIERHFFKDKLLISHDFTFGFCIPNSVNSWEHTYEFPTLPLHVRNAMISEPYFTKSDSFYFANSVLILHNKAEYSFVSK
ncbi:hypothetical protein GE061_014333 [Apolygus lucorum]|uniref:GMP phosphodiesterase delta subunit domain-containing protein n=1 Tax=Apolygus lucorum TaxID=248454 RepID=A0A8S9XQJ9_APOLU|nr:hypothetical protein GE061_014333 [Apolygus lucorum]